MRNTLNRRKSLYSFVFFLSFACFAFSNALCRESTLSDQQELLSAQLRSGDEEQRIDAAVKLGNLSAAPALLTEETMQALSAALKTDRSSLVRALSARALGLSGDTRVTGVLIDSLKHERQIAVRKAIAYALARYPKTPPSEVTAALIDLLRDKKNEVRAAAAYGLAEHKDPSSLPSLIEFLEKRRGDEDAFGRGQAARGIGRIAAREGIEPLLKVLLKDKSHDVQREAAEALGRLATIQDEKVINALRASKSSSDPYLALAADAALTRIQSK